MTSYKNLLLTLIAIFACFVPTAGQSFKNISGAEEDPINGVLAITQDKDGLMWFGTLTGLIRYDTRTLKPYGRDPGGKPIFSDLRDMISDSQGRIWVGTASELTLYDPNTADITHFKHDSTRANTLSDEWVNCLIEDSKKQIWAGTRHGLTRIVTGNGSVQLSRHLQHEFKGGALNIKCMAEGKDGTLWLGTADGLIRMPVNGGKPKLYQIPQTPPETQPSEVLSIFTNDKGVIWLGNSLGGLIRFDSATGVFSPITGLKNTTGGVPVVREIISDGRGKLLLATDSGLAHFNPSTGEADWYINQPGNPQSLPENALFSAYLDNQGGLWLGSYYSGVHYFHFNSPRFKRWPVGAGDPLAGSFVNAWIGKSKTNRMWSISDKADKLLLFDANGKNPATFPLKLAPEADYYSFYIDQNEVLWAGGNTLLTSYDFRRGIYRHYPFAKPGQAEPANGRTYAINEDSFGHFWVGGRYGLLLFDKTTGTFTKAPTVTYTTTIFEDSRHNIWIGGKAGLYRIKAEAARSPMPAIEKIRSEEDFVISWRINEDRAGNIWAACHTQLLKYNPEKNQFELNTDIPREAALDVVPDSKGYIWINASSKLYRYHPKEKTLQSYSAHDGLPLKGTLMQGAGTVDRNGYLYFVTDKGMFSFDPATISIPNRTAPIVLSALKLYNKTVRAHDSTGILPVPIGKVNEITFRHDQSIFTLDFALLDYVRSDVNRYAYKIDGIDRDWNYVQTPSATYTNLPAGSYIFQVKAGNGDGVWTEKPLQIRINVLPPWWRTWYAYAFYLLLTAGIVYITTRFFWIRSSFRRENALNQVKLDFFTNVSHEIRTHLSLISGPLEKAYQQAAEGKNNENYLGYARASSDRLMLLVNELLDFRKIQSGGLRLQAREHDVVRIIKNVIAAFEHMAKDKGIETTLIAPEMPVHLWFDLAQMQKVFYNLLSNAYKFTPEGGKVAVRVAEISNEVKITVEDNGKGMSQDHLQKLFTYYYQADSEKPGYGIGLALSKAIVERHHGYLTAESRLHNGHARNGSHGEASRGEATRGETTRGETSPGGTTLTIRLLREKRHFAPDELVRNGNSYMGDLLTETTTMPASNHIADAKLSNTILIIEDNDQLRVFIRDLFEGEFNIIEAENGLQGLELANEHLPDIVLSDVMMPEMNGLEVCNKLKSNIATAHIPVVLLTARTQNEQVIEGLESGADDYLAKPFDPRILELKIRNLIRVRDELRAHYRQSALTDSTDGNTIAQDVNEAFIARIRSLVAGNLADPDFGVNELAAQVGMSVSVLYRKLRTLTGMTVNEFVKAIRLNEAKKFLESGVYNVAEVATMIGFDDSKYFSKEFRKVFGKNPNEFKKNTIG
ncbi:hybrid sensor histidine kinase/response regulator transcription factor [Dyadobacter jiangsuensis]|uniref:histidine kinase n=1 Tax=Dyadobacter jiangsuensis TaxID=1591085 RepID=A0A2P8GIJ4_9BACT|nr:hybrid sensor histidine kinase/response regulator transcription factor [Dyadobacter jiangsuensis]PSL33796.1 two component regulator with propeller domain [Dyadobacter jiangsuensis]